MNPYPAYRPSGVEWLGEIPEHWAVKMAKTLGRIRYGLGQPPRESAEGVPLIRATNVERGRIVEKDLIRVDPSDLPVGRDALLRAQEIIVVRSGAYTADSAIVPTRYEGAVTGYDMVMTITDAAIPEFIAYALLAPYLRDAQLIVASIRSAQPHLNAEELGASLVLVPPLAEQAAIVEFLDRETKRIDWLVTKKRQLIERLQEYRTALITRTVTRGLPPDAARAAGLDPSPRLKPSGVEWLGDVPVHWEVKPLRSLVSFRSGTTPSKSREEFWDGDIPWVSPKDMKRALIADSEDHVTCAALAESACTMLPVQSVLVVVRGMILAHSFPVAITAAPVTINQDMKGLMTHEPLSHEFLYWFLVGAARPLVSLCDESAHGTRKLETATLAGFLTPLPPYGEQVAIARFLDAQTRRLDELVRRAVAAIDRLQEYRTAIINAAVTGKVDVREPLGADGS